MKKGRSTKRKDQTKKKKKKKEKRKKGFRAALHVTEVKPPPQKKTPNKQTATCQVKKPTLQMTPLRCMLHRR